MKRVLKGLTIFAKYSEVAIIDTRDEGLSVSDHSTEDTVLAPRNMWKEDVDELTKFGWLYDEHWDCWRWYDVAIGV